MNKVSRFFEIIYLVIVVVSVKEVITEWNADRNRAYLFIGFALVSIFMFFFKRHYRKKFAARKRDK